MISRLIKRFNTNFKNILVENKRGYSIITLNRPKALNALCNPLISELNEALKTIEGNNDIKSVILTGSKKAFAAGADIKEMEKQYFPHTLTNKMLGDWTNISKFNKPLIAAVDGYALGGGFELALMADILIASTNAKFGLPEITLGTIPGCGGTQRLIRECGKSKAMEMIFTGKFITAEEAKNYNIISRLVESDNLLIEAEKLAQDISKFSTPILVSAKDCINKSYELGLDNGIEYEKKVFWATFATHDRKEGMEAFVEKRKPDFKNE